MERYDVDAAGRHLRAADPSGSGRSTGSIHVAFALVKSRRLQARGELRGAMTLLTEAAAPTDRPAPAWLVPRGHPVVRQAADRQMEPAQEALAAVREFPEPDAADVVVAHAASLAALGSPEPAREAGRQIDRRRQPGPSR